MPLKRSSNLSTPQTNAPRLKLDWEIPYFAGIDTTSDPASSAPDGMIETASPDTLNTVFDSVQSVGTRKGYTKLLTTSLTNFIGGMYPFYQSNGAKQLVYASGANLYKYNNVGGSTALTGSPANFTPNQQWDFDEFLDRVYGGNGVDPFTAYDGTSYSPANAAVNPQFVKFRTNRAYLANKNSSTLYFSDAGDPTSFPAGNFIEINTNDGQNITGLGVILDSLYIFKDDSVYVLTGEAQGSGNTTYLGSLTLRQANSSVGCSAFRTIQRVEQNLIFMHHSGINVVQNYSVQLISPFLKDTFKNDTNSGFMNLSWAVYNSLENKYIMGYPSAVATKPDSAIVYDLISKQYTLWDHIPGNCAINFKFSGLQETILMGDPNKGIIYELLQGYADIFGDNGTATGGSATTLVDSSKSWSTNVASDARVKIVSGTSAGSMATVTSNNATSLTVGFWSNGAPSTDSVYSIGWYDSYWISKNFDFDMTGYSKKYRFFNCFLDSSAYPIKFGYSVDFQPLDYQKPLRLDTSFLSWNPALNWGIATGNWGSFASLFAQANIGSVGRYIQFKFGNDLANQPWRVIKYSVSYKLKRERSNLVTT